MLARSYGRCEAEVEVRGVWTRCFTSPVEVHHALTAGTERDGVGLDAFTTPEPDRPAA